MSEKSARCRSFSHRDCDVKSCSCTCHPSNQPDLLAQIAESLKPVGEFFERLGKGEVLLFPENVIQITGSGGNMVEKVYRVVISPKGGEGK